MASPSLGMQHEWDIPMVGTRTGTQTSAELHAGASSGRATPAALLLRQHPKSQHCLIPSWMVERQPQGDNKGFIVHWIRAQAQGTTVVGHNAACATRTCFP